jgi:hypothetical protein
MIKAKVQTTTKKKVKKSTTKNNLPFLIVKLGDKERGWIPSKDHQDAFIEMSQLLGLDKRFNIIVYHYGIDFEILDNKNNLKDYGLQIVDINAFNEFVKKTSIEKKVLQDYYRDEVLDLLREDRKEKTSKTKKITQKRPKNLSPPRPRNNTSK